MQILCYEVRISVSGVGESAAASLVRKFSPKFKTLCKWTQIGSRKNLKCVSRDTDQ